MVRQRRGFVRRGIATAEQRALGNGKNPTKEVIFIYECENGHLFDEPAQQVEDEGFDTELGHRAVKVIYEVCPYCGTDCFESYSEDYDEF